MQEIKFRGLEIEELKKLTLEEFSNLLTSRERRALRRGFTEDEKKLLKNIRKDPKKFHKTHERRMIIVPELVGLTLGVHNGKEFVRVDVKSEMLGHRLGEFAMTRKTVKHSAPGFGATKSSKFVPLK